MPPMLKRKWNRIWIYLALTLICRVAEISAQDTATGTPPAYPVVLESDQHARLSSEMNGVLRTLAFDVGATVKKGDVIATVDTRELELQKKRSSVAMNHLNVQVKDLSGLIQQGLATNEDLARARMQRDVAQTEIEIYGLQIAKSTIRAPFACSVVRRHVQPHEWVTAGQPVVDVVGLESIRAVANIPAGVVVTLKPEQTHSVFVTDLGLEVTGKIIAVAPEVDERSDTAQVIWQLDAAGKNLMPGMKGEVRIGQ